MSNGSDDYVPTRQDQALISEAMEAFLRDARYLESIIWAARNREIRAENKAKRIADTN